jgi:putative transcriptional regulator
MATNMRMKLARVEKGYSQQDLADRVGATRQTIGLIEKGKYNPSLRLCVGIAKALDRTLDQLFWEEAKRDERAAV